MDERALRTLEFFKIRSMLVDRAQTHMGKELAEALLPAAEFLEVRHRQAETSEARMLMRAGASLPLGGIRDVRAPLRRAALGAALEPIDLLELAGTIAAGRRLRKFLFEVRDQALILGAHAGQIGAFPALERAIGDAITDEATVADHASPELARIRKDIKVLQNRVRERMDAMVRNPNMRTYLQDSVITIRDDRFVLPVKVEHRHQVPGIVHDQSASGSTLFVEPMAVVEINNDIKRLAAAEREEVARILQQLSGLVAAEAGPLAEMLEALAHIDFVAAKGRLSQDLDCIAPDITEQPQLHIRKGRHPLLTGTVVPVDVHLGKTFDVLVITGPNTGGKTVSLKLVGLFSLMSQAGLHVPATYGTELCVFPQIFADIGDEQSIEQSLSTFSGHMTQIVRILDQLEPGSLVLLDELGAGTDPSEGATLGMAILEHLQNRGARVIATTHYPELKAFAFTRPRIENASVEFDLDTLRPTYKLLIGVPGASQAYEISIRLGLSPVLVERARAFLSRDEERVETLLRRIQETRIVLEQEREAATVARADAVRQQAEAAQRLRRTRLREQEVLEKARAEAAAMLAAVRREADAVMRDLKEVQRQQRATEQTQALEAARQRLRALDQQARDLEPEAEPGGPPPTDLRPGETVRIRTVGALGHVLTAPDAGGKLEVQAGILKMTVHVSDLERAEEPARAATAAGAGEAAFRAAGRGSSGSAAAGSAMRGRAEAFAPEVDLRGLTVEEALEKVDKYLDDAVLAGAGQVRIIHGKGTGALRKAIQDHLRSHRAVTSHRLGGLGEGGDGVTVARLQE